MFKNLNETDVAYCLYALEDVQRENRKQDVLLRDRVMTRADINTYLKKTKRREETLRAATARPAAWPSHVTFTSSQRQLETPPISRGHQGVGPELSPSQPLEQASPFWTATPSWNASSSPSKLLTPRSSLSQRTSVSSMHVAHFDIANMMEGDNMLVEGQNDAPLDADILMADLDSWEDDEVSEGDMARIRAGVTESDDFGAMISRTVAPKPLSGSEGTNPLFFSLLSGTVPATHRPGYVGVLGAETQSSESTAVIVMQDREAPFRSRPTRLTSTAGDRTEIQVEPSVWFLRQCLSACIVRGQGLDEEANNLVFAAVESFRRMTNQVNPGCLTTLHLLVSVLESLGQRALAETILKKILETADNHLDDESPIGATIGFMLAIVNCQVRQSQYDTARMRRVHQGLSEVWGEDSPSALVGLYHVAWSLALDQETRGEAWAILEPLNVKCEVTLGQCHFQTITAMTTSARVLYHLGEHWQAARMINRAIQRLDLMYEDFHPYCLEARSRQAKLLMKLDGSHDVETILQDVVRQQAAILGFHNPRTQSTLATLQGFLKSKGRSQEAHSLPEVLERVSNNDPFNQ